MLSLDAEGFHDFNQFISKFWATLCCSFIQLFSVDIEVGVCESVSCPNELVELQLGSKPTKELRMAFA